MKKVQIVFEKEVQVSISSVDIINEEKNLSSVKFRFLELNNKAGWGFIIVENYNEETFFQVHAKNVVKTILGVSPRKIISVKEI